ncbi:MAG: hypothetical protein JST83_16680 [Bacteroidetes bacterium]|nr:hypothetical protein [Bacteroidota bacterium]
MKKLLPYIVVLLLLGAGVAFFLYRYSPSTLSRKESEFIVRDVDAMTKIVLTDIKGQKVTLTKEGRRWMVNGKYEINEESQGLLFTAIQKMETQYPVPEKAQPLVLKEMAAKRVRCEIYTGGAQPYKVYYVGGPTADGIGTYVLMEVDGRLGSRPYVVHIPGIEAYLTSRFYTDEEYWRSKWVYRDNAATIKDLSVTYDREKQKSFALTRIGERDTFVITNSDGLADAQPRQRFIHQYLEFFDGLSLEAFENKNPLKDSILGMQPYCTIKMKRVDGSETNVEIYYMPINEQSRQQFDDKGRKLLYDVEHYYIAMNNRRDFGLIQYYVWGKALRTYQDFYVRPGMKQPTVESH